VLDTRHPVGHSTHSTSVNTFKPNRTDTDFSDSFCTASTASFFGGSVSLGNKFVNQTCLLDTADDAVGAWLRCLGEVPGDKSTGDIK